MQLILLERKILLFSEHKALLHDVALALTTLIFPFHWPHVLIPVMKKILFLSSLLIDYGQFQILPQALFDYVQAPVPFIIGINTTGDEIIEDRAISDDVKFSSWQFSVT